MDQAHGARYYRHMREKLPKLYVYTARRFDKADGDNIRNTAIN